MPQPWTHGSFYWNELMSRDAERDKKFYADTLGWNFEGMPMPEGGTYWIAKIGGQPVGGIFDISAPQFGPVPESWMSYIAVDDVDARVKKAQSCRRHLDEADLRCAGRRPHRRLTRTGRRRHRLDDAHVLKTTHHRSCHEAYRFPALAQHLEGARRRRPSRPAARIRIRRSHQGRSHTPDYLALNPTGRTPVLIDGDFKLWESTAIMQYLASQKPNSLWPDDARTRADIMRWQSWQLAHFSKEGCEPLLFQRIVKQILNLGPPDEAIVAKGLECFNKEAAVLDAHLAKQPYLVGNDRDARRLLGRGAVVLCRARRPAARAVFARERWFGRVSALPCWQETMPQFTAAAA